MPDLSNYTERFVSEELLREWIIDGADIYDTRDHAVYMSDIGDDNFYGVMFAQLESGEGTGEDPSVFALEVVPAPGTGASRRMEQLSLEDTVYEVMQRPDDFVISLWNNQ